MTDPPVWEPLGGRPVVLASPGPPGAVVGDLIRSPDSLRQRCSALLAVMETGLAAMPDVDVELEQHRMQPHLDRARRLLDADGDRIWTLLADLVPSTVLRCLE